MPGRVRQTDIALAGVPSSMRIRAGPAILWTTWSRRRSNQLRGMVKPSTENMMQPGGSVTSYQFRQSVAFGPWPLRRNLCVLSRAAQRGLDHQKLSQILHRKQAEQTSLLHDEQDAAVRILQFF